MTLDEYSVKVLRPLSLKAVTEGQCDFAIQLTDVLDFYKDDIEMMQTINDRLKAINEKP